MRIVSGVWKGRQIKTAEGPGYRPAMAKTREAIFSMLEARLGSLSGLRVLDLFAGSGSLGVEALSRGAEFARFVELSRPAARLIAENLRQLGAEPGSFRVETADVLDWLKRSTGVQGERYDLIFVDPPYGREFAEKSLALAASGGYLADGGLLLAEVEADRPDPVPGMLAEFAPALALETDRRYGQTRVIVWRKAKDDIGTSSDPETDASPS